MSLAVVGCTAIDLILTRTPRLPTWPRHSEFTSDNLVLLADAPLVTLGGNGANAAFVAAQGGARVTLHTRIGRIRSVDSRAVGWKMRAASLRLRHQRRGPPSISPQPMPAMSEPRFSIRVTLRSFPKQMRCAEQPTSSSAVGRTHR